jgi:hypothetical protein
VGQQETETHTALIIGADEAALEATAAIDSDLVVFLVDRNRRPLKGVRYGQPAAATGPPKTRRRS